MRREVPQSRHRERDFQVNRLLFQSLMSWHYLCVRLRQNILTPAGAHGIVSPFFGLFYRDDTKG